jgi:peptidyl-prolyl cis-trans isomerase B (cyclophilin B)
MKRSLIFVILLSVSLVWLSGCRTDQAKETKTDSKGETVKNVEAKSPQETKLEAQIQTAIEQTKVDPEVAIMETSQGKIVIGFFPDVAPGHVARFKELAREGFYEGILFHRVIPNFVIQGGDPDTKNPDIPRARHGIGGTGKHLKAEFNARPHLRGTLSAARSNDPNSADSQFFICHARAASLDNKYTVYGQVLEGMDVVDKIVNAPRDQRDNPNEPQKILSVKIVKRDEL